MNTNPQQLLNNENLVHNFQNMINNLHKETKLLKFSLALRQNSSGANEMNSKLYKLSSNINSFESNLNEFEEFLDQELNVLAQFEELDQLAVQQNQEIQDISKSLPSFFQGNNKIQKTNNNTNQIHGNNSNGEVKELLIELNEFENIPKSTRSRLTLEQIIEAINNIQSLLIKKGEKLNLQQKLRSSSQITALEEYRSLQHIDHQGKMFLTEKELRGSVIFEGGDATGRAILQTLRALHRIKLVRSNGESTYILIANK